MNTIKDMVKDNKKVTFLFFKKDEFWYQTECGFKFPVPYSDIGDATMLATDKAILFMRYIKPHLKLVEDTRKSAQQEAEINQSMAQMYVSMVEQRT